MQHILKVHPQFWGPLCEGNKGFELRRNDRNYAVGDTLRLLEYDPTYGFTTKERLSIVTYILKPEDCPGLQPGFCILGLGPVL